MIRDALVASICALALAACGAGEEGAPADPRDAPEIHRVGDLEIIDPWAKSAIGVHEARLFFRFRNHGEADRLESAASTVAVGPTYLYLVEAGESGPTRRALEAIDIPPTDTPYELSEGGYYVELTELDVPLVMGSRFEVELRFARAGSVTVPFTNRFHSPELSRRIREAAQSGDLETLRALRDESAP